MYDSLSVLPFDTVPESEKNISEPQGSLIVIFFVLIQIHNHVYKALLWWFWDMLRILKVHFETSICLKT
jgi:hypothetical protein